MNQEFALVYVGNFSYESVENMPQMERRYMYEKLSETKKKEKDEFQRQSPRKKSNAPTKSYNSGSNRKPSRRKPKKSKGHPKRGGNNK